MALLTSLFSGVSGLRNHQSMMDVIGDNIANVNTIGYKSSRVTFSDTFSQFFKSGTNPTETSGGTNTMQIGLGMQINSIDRNWNQGTFERTGISTDLALQGPGLFILKSNGQNYYSRAGAFQFDANGNLVSTQNGAVVQGKLASKDGVIPPGNNLEDIKIDTNLKLPAVATSLIKWGGNLKSSSENTASENVVLRGSINASGTPEPVTTTVYDVYGNKNTLKVNYNPTGTPNEYSLDWEILDPSTNAQLYSGTLPTVTFGSDGKMDAASIAAFDGVTNKVSPSADINFVIDPTAITLGNSTTTLSISADGNREPNIVSGSVSVFDSLGNSHQVTLKFTKITDGNWTWTASVPGGSTLDGKTATSTGTLSFNPDGTLDPTGIAPSNPQLTFVPTGGADPLVVDLDMGKGLDGITQTSSSSAISALSQDGSAAASLSNINIDQYGNIVGLFSNGNSKTLGKIMTATFQNRNGLINEGGNMFTAFANTGAPKISEFGEESNTTVQAGVLEQSNVDLSQEFTKMIISQRGFQANARIITTADNMLQEINNLIR